MYQLTSSTMPTRNKPKKEQAFTKERAVLKKLKLVLSAAKAENIQIYDLVRPKKNAYTDFIVIATALSTLHLKALARMAKRTLKTAKIGIISGHKHDPNEERWIIIDCGSIILHLFMKEDRTYYDLDGKLTTELTTSDNELFTAPEDS
ncbi:ribosomal silencing factor RsfS [Spirochaetota bacterium]|nr:ribosomal silencing factor RsfS [Spirochaetota bacterium]